MLKIHISADKNTVAQNSISQETCCDYRNVLSATSGRFPSNLTVVCMYIYMYSILHACKYIGGKKNKTTADVVGALPKGAKRASCGRREMVM